MKKKIKEIIHPQTHAYQVQGPSFRLTLDAIHELQEKVEEIENTQTAASEMAALIAKVQQMEEMLMTLPEFKLKKYQTPWGDFDTYGAAARAMPLKEGESILPWTEIRSRIKSSEYPEYYFNV